MSKKYTNVVQCNRKYYNLEDNCIHCGHAFESNEDGSTKAGAYPQLSTLFLRVCLICGTLQEWKLKRGKQPWLHKINTDLLEE